MRGLPREHTQAEKPMKSRSNITLVLALSLPTLLGGCAAAAVVGVGLGAVAISQEVTDSNIYVTRLNMNVTEVWPTAKIFMSDQSLELIETDEESRIAKARIDGANVTVYVEAYDLDKSTMRISAKRYGINDGDMARIITERITRKLDQVNAR
jgi:hypothetical protein